MKTRDLIFIKTEDKRVLIDFNKVREISEVVSECKVIIVFDDGTSEEFKATTKAAHKDLFNTLCKKMNEDVDPSTLKTIEVL